MANTKTGPNVMKLPVSGTDGDTALIDADDGLASVRWRLHANGNVQRYYTHGGKRKWVFLKRVVMGLLPGDMRGVIVVNGNKLDCRRCNLVVTPTLSAANDPVVRRLLIEEAGGGC